MDLYIQAIPVGTYRVQSPGFPKIVYYYAIRPRPPLRRRLLTAMFAFRRTVTLRGSAPKRSVTRDLYHLLETISEEVVGYTLNCQPRSVLSRAQELCES